MPGTSSTNSALDRQLLLDLGARLRRARVERGLTTSQMAERAGISRMTLSAIEAGEPTPTIGSYVRVMSVLDVSKDLVLVGNRALVPPTPPGRHDAGGSDVVVSVGNARHDVQDLQSLLLHQEAVRLVQKRPELLQQALDTLERWRDSGASSSRVLWDEWSVILHRRDWRRVLSHTRRSRELRQASPLTTVLPADVRERILEEVRQLKGGVVLGSLPAKTDRHSLKGSRRGT